MTYVPTALSLSVAARQSIQEEEVAKKANFIIAHGNLMEEQILKEYLAEFAIHLTAVVTQNVTNIFMTEDQIAEMMSEIAEFDEMGKNISEE